MHSAVLGTWNKIICREEDKIEVTKKRKRRKNRAEGRGEKR
jgi:hypothetical protein